MYWELQWGRPSRDDCDVVSVPPSRGLRRSFNGVVPLGTIATGSPASSMRSMAALQWGRPTRDDCDLRNSRGSHPSTCFNGVVPLGTIATRGPRCAARPSGASMGSSHSGRLRPVNNLVHKHPLSASFNGVVPLGTIATRIVPVSVCGSKKLQWGRPSRDDCDACWERESPVECASMGSSLSGRLRRVLQGVQRIPRRASMGSSLSGRLRLAGARLPCNTR